MVFKKTGEELYVSTIRLSSGFFGLKAVYEDGSFVWLSTSLATEGIAVFLAEAFLQGETLDL
jgi:hypothetical protein